MFYSWLAMCFGCICLAIWGLDQFGIVDAVMLPLVEQDLKDMYTDDIHHLAPFGIAVVVLALISMWSMVLYGVLALGIATLFLGGVELTQSLMFLKPYVSPAFAGVLVVVVPALVDRAR